MAPRGVVAAVVVVLGLAACTGRPPPASVSGVLQYIGGPPVAGRDGTAQSPPPVGHAGVVEFTPVAGGPVRRVSTRSDGRFWTSLPAGLYAVSGNPGQDRFWCVGGDITVRSGEPDRVEVDCPIL